MIKQGVQIILVVFWAITGLAQNTTLEKEKPEKPDAERLLPQSAAENTAFDNVLLIPFEPKLYMSEIDKEVAVKNNLSAREINATFRKGLLDNVYMESRHKVKAIPMLSEDPEVTQDLYYIYQSIGYKYKVLPQEEDVEGKSKAQQVFDKIKEKVEPKQEEPGSGIRNGQVYSVPQREERFMSTVVVNPNMLSFLAQKYGAGYFVFINQLDLQIAPGTDYRALEGETYKRLAKVHYTILDKEGNEIYAGAAKTYFSSMTNDIDRIIKGSFDELARVIAGNIPVPEPDPVMEQKRKEEKKKAEEQDILEQY